MKKLFLIGAVLFVFGITVTKAQSATDEVRTISVGTEVSAEKTAPAPAATSTDEKKSCAMPCCSGKKSASAHCSDKDKAKCDKAKAKKGCCAGKKEASNDKKEEKPNN